MRSLGGEGRASKAKISKKGHTKAKLWNWGYGYFVEHNLKLELKS